MALRIYVNGVERDMTPEEEAEHLAAQAAAVHQPTSDDVDRERNRRIAAGFVFEGVLFQARPDDRENIDGAQSAAKDAIARGALAGDLSWRRLIDPAGPEVFAWIAADNSLVPMDAPTVVRFAYAALAHKEAMIFTARTLKDMDPVPADYVDNSRWP